MGRSCAMRAGKMKAPPGSFQRRAMPVFRLYNPNAGDHHYTMDAKEKDGLIRAGWTYEGIGWYSDLKEGTPVYRVYNPNARTGSHHFTTDSNGIQLSEKSRLESGRHCLVRHSSRRAKKKRRCVKTGFLPPSTITVPRRTNRFAWKHPNSTPHPNAGQPIQNAPARTKIQNRP